MHGPAADEANVQAGVLDNPYGPDQGVVDPRVIVAEGAATNTSKQHRLRRLPGGRQQR